jgi:hypothetical protein
MERKEFLKRLGLGSFVLPLITACSEEEDPTATIDTSTSGTCTTTPTETAGPFPTKDPSSLEMVDITSDRVGVPMTISGIATRMDIIQSMVEPVCSP